MLAVKNQAKLRIQESGCAKDDLNLGVFNLCLFEFVRVKDALILYLIRLPPLPGGRAVSSGHGEIFGDPFGSRPLVVMGKEAKKWDGPFTYFKASKLG